MKLEGLLYVGVVSCGAESVRVTVNQSRTKTQPDGWVEGKGWMDGYGR